MASKTILLLMALAVFASPMIITARGAHAATPNQAIDIMHSGHCSSTRGGMHYKAATRPCCVAICAVLAITASSVIDEPSAIGVPSALIVRSLHTGFLGDIATPPPRRG